MNKYQEVLECIGNIDLDTLSNGYDSPKYLKDFYYGKYKLLQELVDKEAHKKSGLDKDLTNEELKTFSLLLDKIRIKDCNCSLGCPLDCIFYCESNGNSDCALDKVENWCEGKKEEVGLNVIELD